MADNVETPSKINETVKPEGTLEDIKTFLDGKLKVYEQVGEDLKKLKDDFGSLDTSERLKRIGGILAAAFLGLFMDKKEMAEYRKDRNDIRVTDLNEELIQANPRAEVQSGIRREVKHETGVRNRKTKKVIEMAQDHGSNLNLVKVLPKHTERIKIFETLFEKHKKRFESVSEKTGVPARLIASMYCTEGGIKYNKQKKEWELNFDKYLHNGQPLGSPTTAVPKDVYFEEDQWELAAIHALGGYNDGRECFDLRGKKASEYAKDNREKLGLTEHSKDMGSMLAFAELYNGKGYRNRGKMSSYVYAGTNLAPRGRYAGDGNFIKEKSKNLGVAGFLIGGYSELKLANSDDEFIESEEAGDKGNYVEKSENRVLTYPIHEPAKEYLKAINENEPLKEAPHPSDKEPRYVKSTIAYALHYANELAAKDGYQILVSSGYRSPKEQAAGKTINLEKRGKTDKWMAQPGKSWHQSGGAVDVGLYRINETKFSQKLTGGKAENSEKYRDMMEKYMNAAGFVRYDVEAWHFEIGTEQWSAIMKKQGIMDVRTAIYKRDKPGEASHHEHA